VSSELEFASELVGFSEEEKVQLPLSMTALEL
jgi:hypothetical protein